MLTSNEFAELWDKLEQGKITEYEFNIINEMITYDLDKHIFSGERITDTFVWDIQGDFYNLFIKMLENEK